MSDDQTFAERYAMPRFMQHATRHPYEHLDEVGWAAWWEFLGATIAFEGLDGRMVYRWEDDPSAGDVE